MGTNMYPNPFNGTRKFVMTLPMLANELLCEIAAYLPRSDQFSMVCTCWTLHGTTSRLMYRRVTISDLHARIFFKTIAESDEDYGKHVRDLRYFVTSTTDVMFTYLLLCDAIPHMELLQKLTIGARQSHSDQLLQMLVKRSIVKTVSSPSRKHEIRLEPEDILGLVNLQTLILHGAVDLINLTRSRNITSICVTETMNTEDFATFIDAATNGTNRNYIIRELILTLKHSLGSRIGLPILTLANTFPNIETLMIRTLLANALEASHILSTTPILPKLRSFHLNDWTILRPMFILPQEFALKQQKTHIEQASTMRQHLESVNFGTIHWDKKTNCNEWIMHEDTNSNKDDEDYADQNDECPLFWDVTYNSPRPLSSKENEIIQEFVN